MAAVKTNLLHLGKYSDTNVEIKLSYATISALQLRSVAFEVVAVVHLLPNFTSCSPEQSSTHRVSWNPSWSNIKRMFRVRFNLSTWTYQRHYRMSKAIHYFFESPFDPRTRKPKTVVFQNKTHSHVTHVVRRTCPSAKRTFPVLPKRSSNIRVQ